MHSMVTSTTTPTEKALAMPSKCLIPINVLDACSARTEVIGGFSCIFFDPDFVVRNVDQIVVAGVWHGLKCTSVHKHPATSRDARRQRTPSRHQDKLIPHLLREWCALAPRERRR